MHSEPSNAAMERAQSMSGYMNASASFIPVAAVARYIDTVDRVAREAIAHIHLCGGFVGDLHPLRSLLLPDEPDGLELIFRSMGYAYKEARNLAHGFRDKSAAAGYTITKEPTV